LSIRKRVIALAAAGAAALMLGGVVTTHQASRVDASQPTHAALGCTNTSNSGDITFPVAANGVITTSNQSLPAVAGVGLSVTTPNSAVLCGAVFQDDVPAAAAAGQDTDPNTIDGGSITFSLTSGIATLLQTNAFHRIPPANIQAIFQRLQRVPCTAGEVVIKQGAEGDYFYIIVNGKCVVTRETPLSREGIKLAELGVGDTFGEEALIAEAKRNATVTMLADGVLMRLNKQDFRELMNEPLLQWVTPEAARKLVVDRGARWLDVRLPSEHQNLAIEGSINVPLYLVRLRLSTLDRNRPYILYCDTGRRSSAAAYILVERGLDAYVLKGGLSNTGLPLTRGGAADKP